MMATGKVEALGDLQEMVFDGGGMLPGF